MRVGGVVSAPWRPSGDGSEEAGEEAVLSQASNTVAWKWTVGDAANWRAGERIDQSEETGLLSAQHLCDSGHSFDPSSVPIKLVHSFADKLKWGSPKRFVQSL